MTVSQPTSGLPRKPRRRFITRAGNRLYDGAADYRIAGVKMAWQGLDFFSGGFAPPPTGTVGVPSRWRIDDAYATLQMMGVNCVIGYTLGGSCGFAGTLYPTLGGAYDETVFRAMDYAIARAPYYGLRLIPTLTDWTYNYYRGGISQFNYWGGGSETAFYTGTTALTNFKAYVSTVLNRVNTLTGVRYGADPTIIAWETANEAPNPSSWSSTIAAHIKSIAPNQLVYDGHYGIDANSLADPNIDIVSNHYYPMSTSGLAADLATANLSDRVFVVGEYDWNSVRGGDTLASFLSLIESSAAVRGDFWWNLSSHGDTHGWPLSSDDYSFLGAQAGNYDVRYGDPAFQTKIDLLRAHAYTMRGVSAPPIPAPGVPTASKSGSDVNWQGAAGAKSYTVERSVTSASAGFSAVATGLDDTQSPWTDPSPPGSPVWYRVKAVNGSAVSQPSNVLQY